MADLTGMMQAAAGAGEDATFIEDVFSTYLYTGNSSTQTITNGIDLSTEGGLVWIKNRGLDPSNHFLFDTLRGAGDYLRSNQSSAEGNFSPLFSSFNTNGFSLNGNSTDLNATGNNYVSWTFRKQEKFFDVVTYTGTGANRTVAHALGSVPGCIMVKRTDNTGDWQVYHRANTASPETDYLVLNDTAATADSDTRWNDTQPTDAVFSLGTEATVNASGGTYVAYLFAHDAGGFGLTGTDNVISCGSYVGNGTSNGPVVTLGYEPQWLMVKDTTNSGQDWVIQDVMRGMTVTAGEGVYLRANSSVADAANSYFTPLPTGFQPNQASAQANASSATYIYIAIRRGPMKVPELGTSVFGLSARTGTGANATVTGSAGVSDAVLVKNRGSAVASLFAARLTGTNYLVTSTTAAQVAAATTILQANPWDVMDGVKVGTTSTITNASANTYINYLFDRAPSFFDVVCYTGTGSNLTLSHNLGAVPELMIVKIRGVNTGFWAVYSATLGNTKVLRLNGTQAEATTAGYWTSTPTASVFYVGTNNEVNIAADTYVAYLFATCPGVSKVGSYTGTAAAQTINCGFTAGARFILIKRTDDTGDWYVWDTARGIIAGDDPYWLTNSANAEVTNTDYIDTAATGFELTSTAPAAINASGGTYIFLAIA
jgi:hypothetical protein